MEVNIEYVVVLGFVIFVYAAMVIKFRQCRKRLEALQKMTHKDSFEMQGIKFQQQFWIIPKSLRNNEIPGLVPKTVTLVGYKDNVTAFGNEKVEKSMQRRSSSVVKRFSILVSHARAVTYVFVIVSVYLATWTPFFVFCLYKSITRMHIETDTEQDGLDLTLLKDCLEGALQNQNTTMEINSKAKLEEFTKLIFQSLEMKIFSNIFGNYVPMLNSLANPVLYGLWYPDFRNYARLIQHWIISAIKKVRMNWKRNKNDK